MRCRPWRWLWGLLPLALIVFLTTIGERQRIERDLTVRTEQALRSEGLGWARLRFEGRDGVLEGTAPSEDDRSRARAIAQQIHGVRMVRTGSAISVVVSPYVWRARRANGRIVLSGHVPDDAAREAVLGFARARFPGAPIDDQMKQAPGAPENGLWTAAARFALNRLGELESGTVSLSDTTLAIKGRASSPIGFRQVSSALASRLPAGIALGEQTVEVPAVKPYEWSFDRLGDVVVLNGYVPDDETRERLITAARARYLAMAVSDRMLVAGGAPDGFEALALAALDESSELEEVRIALRERKVTITGLAANQLASGEVAGRITSRAGGFAVANKLRFRTIVPPVASPYEWSARENDGVVVLSGHVPDDAARQQLLEQARKLHPDAAIRDEMTLASGVPDTRDTWLAAAGHGLAAMALLDEGRAELTGRTLRVNGNTSDAAVRQRSELLLGTDVPAGFDVARGIRLLAPPEPEVDLEAQARERAENERKRKVAEEAESLRKAESQAVAEALRRREEAERKSERRRIKVAAAQVAERKRKLASAREAGKKREAAAQKRIAAEQKRIALVREVEAANRKRLADLAAERQSLEARRQAEFNGTPLDLWQARRAARVAGKDLSTVDTAAYNDGATVSRGKLMLTGKVASPEVRDHILKLARARFVEDVVDNLEVIDGAPDSAWLEAADAGLNELSRLRNGALLVTQGKIELYGDAVTEDAARAVRGSIDRRRPGPFEVSFLVTAPRALKPKEVEVALRTKKPVAAEACGNLMNSLASLAPIRFEVDSAEIGDPAYPTLDKLAFVAQKCPNARVRISGHTDSNGSREYNQELSDRRAASVLAYLAGKGVERNRMRARGMGETQPLVKNTTPEQRAKNRRIEFSVTRQ